MAAGLLNSSENLALKKNGRNVSTRPGGGALLAGELSH